MELKHIYKITVNGQDITDILQKNAASLSLQDAAGILSDELTIAVAGDFERPKYKDELKLWLGYEGENLTYMGLFKVQTTERLNKSMTITATSAEFAESLKVKNTRSYENMSLKEIALKIGQNQGLEVKSDCDDLFFTHISQTAESDLSFLKRLANKYNLIFSIKNNLLIFKKILNDQGKNPDLPVFELDAKETDGSLRIKHSNKTFYSACLAAWHDTKQNKTQKILHGSGSPVLKIKDSFKNEQEACLKAKAKLQTANKGTKTGSASLAGSAIFAGSTLKLFNSFEDDGEYTIKSVSHDVSSKWSTTIDFEN